MAMAIVIAMAIAVAITEDFIMATIRFVFIFTWGNMNFMDYLRNS